MGGFEEPRESEEEMTRKPKCGRGNRGAKKRSLYFLLKVYPYDTYLEPGFT